MTTSSYDNKWGGRKSKKSFYIAKPKMSSYSYIIMFWRVKLELNSIFYNIVIIIRTQAHS